MSNVNDDNVITESEEFVFSSNSKLCREEREFHLWFNEADSVWEAESSIPKFWRKLEKKGWTCTGVQYYHDGTICAKTFTSGNKKGVSITDPTKVRIMSEEQKLASSKRFKDFHKSKTVETMDNEDEDDV